MSLGLLYDGDGMLLEGDGPRTFTDMGVPVAAGPKVRFRVCC